MSALRGVPAGTPTPSPAQIRDALLAHLQRRILSQAAGEHVPAGVALPDSPQERHWLGQLASEPQLRADAQRGLSTSKLVPAAQGFSFPVLGGDPVDATVTVGFAVYVALHPTVAEQQEFVTAGSDSRAGGGGQGRHLARVWMKVPVGPVTVPLTVDPGDTSRRFGAEELTLAATAAVKRAVHASGGRELYRARRRGRPVGELPRDADFVDDVAWASYTANNLLPTADVTPPVFAAAIDVDVTSTERGRELLVTVVNASPADDAQFADRAGSIVFDRDHLDSRLYEVQLTAATDAPLDVYTLEQVAASHRYDRTVPAFGQACPVEVHPPATPGGPTTFTTAYGAVTTTRRTHPTAAVDTTFAAFTGDPVTAATDLVDAHRAWVEERWSAAELARREAEGQWGPQQRKDADAEADAARAEMQWLQAGVDALRGDAKLRRAFALMNDAMGRVAAAKGFDAWYPFQIAWIIGCLPAVADPTADLAVQILTVPPGGGKSEAYNGVALVHLFLSRLRGDLRGVTVWARFPLRLLSAQQTERFAAAVLAAELVRLTQDDLRAGDPFGIGFFVGSGTTPNRYWPPESVWARGVDPFDPAQAERCRILEHCPVCDPAGTGPRLVVRFHGGSWTMQHLCTVRGCPLGGVLPLWVVDDDIYRNTPSVLVGTVDKLAQIAHSDRFKVIFGAALGRCPKHGWTVEPTRCGVYGCTEPRLPVGNGFGHLRCEITDELHLLDESLGALDGMYETLVQQIGADLGNEPLHILAATATIEGYEAQAQHLYRRDSARRFPEPGPDLAENFFSHVDDSEPHRRFVGVRPRGTTMVTAAADVTRVHRDWLGEVLADRAAIIGQLQVDGQPLDPADRSVLDLVVRAARDDYEALLAYHLRNEDMAAYASDERVADVATTTEQRAVISGDADAADIRAAVDRLNKPPADPEQRMKLIVANKAIGHGFDSPRLGVMVLMGTPTQAAEVIQATARIGRGRQTPGLVVHVFNPSRDRDSSVFRWYSKWISYLDRLVTKVPVNRESLQVLRRALPGALMARLLQVHDPAWMTSGRNRFSLGDSGQVRAALAAGFLDRNALIAELQTGLGLEDANPYHNMHRDEVREFVESTLVRLPVAAGTGGRTRTASLLRPPVPTSLRDIEEPITITGNL
ncbi:hypothetical protein GB931_17005 [Modestobacter sp. I12A-02628]|uniref:Helicase C-terminal domain-containing protein n=1 Tax=Goekera deserti TaxID=2497753 RepID=A0A7K3WDV2_9ACTN|nr:hypothetical protein [Goekera deserti]MPQ99584.1 hypothetical protein [Goekera deserti]NDI46405.1 hypothetical protein [Goekera deserti]NEL54662.1 hypothetical protein [Goekera deserti]